MSANEGGKAQARIFSTHFHLSLSIIFLLTLWLMLFLSFLLHQPLRAKFLGPYSRTRKIGNQYWWQMEINLELGCGYKGKMKNCKYGLPWTQNSDQRLLFVPLLNNGKKGLKESHIGLGASDNHQGEAWEQEYTPKRSIIQFNSNWKGSPNSLVL